MNVKFKNEVAVSGKLFGLGRFGLKTDKEGRISGSVIVLTDEKTQNTVEVNFAPQSPTYKSGKANSTYEALKQIMEHENEATIEKAGDAAWSVRIDGDLSNRMYHTKKQNSSEYDLHELTQVRGSFLHIDSNAKPYIGFNVDVLFTGITRDILEDGTDKGTATVTAHAYDDYRNYFYPVRFSIDNPLGINALEGFPPKSKTTLSGRFVNQVIEVEEAPNSEMAFGEAAKVTAPKKIFQILITGATPAIPVEFTEEEEKAFKNNREAQILDSLNRAKDKDASGKQSASKAAAAPVVKSSGSDFNF